MKSSSEQYPVALAYTEMWMGYSEDVYLLKTNNSDDKSVELALTRLYDGKQDYGQGQVSIFVHDTFENRNRWLREHEDLLKTLLKEGGDLWLFEMRGHGLSPKNRVYQDNTLNDIAAYDLPAVQSFVSELHPGLADWIGAGEGALAIIKAIEAKKLKAEQIRKVHALNVARFHWMYRYWVPGWAYLKLIFDQRQYFYRPEKDDPEFRGVWRQLVREKGFFGRRRTLSRKHSILGPQLRITTPVVFWLPSENINRYSAWASRQNMVVLPYADIALEAHLKKSS
jgi:pimeloyl-ACP methyl ester carboxylesterase